MADPRLFRDMSDYPSFLDLDDGENRPHTRYIRRPFPGIHPNLIYGGSGGRRDGFQGHNILPEPTDELLADSFMDDWIRDINRHLHAAGYRRPLHVPLPRVAPVDQDGGAYIRDRRPFRRIHPYFNYGGPSGRRDGFEGHNIEYQDDGDIDQDDGDLFQYDGDVDQDDGDLDQDDGVLDYEDGDFDYDDGDIDLNGRDYKQPPAGSGGPSSAGPGPMPGGPSDCGNGSPDGGRDRFQENNRLHSLSRDFKELFITGQDSDITVEVESEKFHVHKVILGIRCPLLANQLKHDMIEKNTDVVKISDYPAEEFKDFLLYLYTDRVESFTPEKALSLYRAADQYNVPDLKADCLEFLKKNLSANSLCDVFALSLKYDEKELVHLAEQFFKDNMRTVLKTDSWVKYCKENFDEANEMFIMAFKDINSTRLSKRRIP